MKKFFSIIALGAMTLSLSSFDNADIQGEDCAVLMNGTYAAYLIAGYNESDAFQAAIWAYEGCAFNGGEEVIINP
jgi:hypothetical protein